MLPANAELEITILPSTARARSFNEFAYPSNIKAGKGVTLEQALLHIAVHEAHRVVAADAEGGLSQIVGTEGEEIGGLRDITGAERRARQFDHGTYDVRRQFSPR